MTATDLRHLPGVDREDVRVEQFCVVGRNALRFLETHARPLRQDPRGRHLVIVADLATQACDVTAADLAQRAGSMSLSDTLW